MGKVHEDYIEVSEILSDVIDYSKQNEDGTYKHERIKTLPKTSTSIRKVFLTSEAKEAIENIKKIQGNYKDTDYVLATKTGAPQIARNLRRMLNNIQERSGMTVQNSGLHVLRHTGISLMARKGIPIDVVSAMAGHKDLSTTQKIYRHVLDSEQSEAVKEAKLL